MPQFPDWKRPIAAYSYTAQLRSSSVRDSVADLAGHARDRLAQLPMTVVEQIRQRINVLNLATRNDVEAQTRLARDRVSYVLKEFLESQRSHDDALRSSLRTELHEELQSFAAATADGMFAMNTTPIETLDDRLLDDDFDDDDDDEFDLIDRQ